ncbi:hypothetical protein OsI_03386 [Oryza sativa Indica Group]|uniref:Uncharacterized protein n=1 Tax=Oryza sativa subsp. indica TaxID=39946 RepID=A2WU40_ORYSI|nr:hypothetical protein OsI_03386 [Oryza sativa Indica Group]
MGKAQRAAMPCSDAVEIGVGFFVGDGDGFISLDEFAALNATASGDVATVVTVGADAKIFFALLFQSDLWREGILGGRIGDIAVAEGDFGR